MPTILRVGPYRFYFFSNEGFEPPHVHVDRDDNSAKLWLDPVALAHSRGFNGRELRRVFELTFTNVQRFLRAWHEYFPNDR